MFKLISVSELARRIGQTPQNFGKKMKRDTVTLDELKQIAENIAGKPAVYKPAGKVIAQVEYRDGTIIDQVYQTK